MRIWYRGDFHLRYKILIEYSEVYRGIVNRALSTLGALSGLAPSGKRTEPGEEDGIFNLLVQGLM